MSNVAIYLNAKNNMPTKDSDSYGTPLWLFEWLDSKYNFDLDLCASHINHRCDKYFTIEQDSLTQNWHKSGSFGFCNPPYSHGMKEKFLAKSFDELKHGFSSVFVIPADVANKCWATHIIGKATSARAVMY